jgi:hypothetical protein
MRHRRHIEDIGLIVKDRNSAEHPETDPRATAGAKGEAQMAFYLQRQFGAPDNREAMVLNDLRLPSPGGDDAAQIDHLVVYRFGLIVIESKSVSTEVRINQNGEWSRRWNGRWQGMASPIHQAQRQVDFLRGILDRHRTELRRRSAVDGSHLTFDDCPIETVIAVSDTGTIDRGGQDLPNVIKAEAVVELIRSTMDRRGSGTGPASEAGPDVYRFTDDELKRITDFLKRRHTPVKSIKKRAALSKKQRRLKVDLALTIVGLVFALGCTWYLKRTILDPIGQMGKPQARPIGSPVAGSARPI